MTVIPWLRPPPTADRTNVLPNCRLRRSGRPRRKDRGAQRAANRVPCIAAVVHALTGACEKRLQGAGAACVIGGDDHEIGVLVHRQKSLRAKRMPLHHLKGEGQGARFCVKDADARAAPAKVEIGQIVMPPAKPLVDDFVRRAAHFQHLAEGAKPSAVRGWSRICLLMAAGLSGAAARSVRLGGRPRQTRCRGHCRCGV